MALPMNSTPVYNLDIPSTGKQIKFRPFLIKEEKSLLVAQQSEDASVMVDTLKEVVRSCVKDDIDVNNLATFDLEYIFTQIRAKSVGEIVDLYLKCDTCEDEKAVAKVSIDITGITVVKSPEHKNNIPLFDDVGIIMKYPTIEVIKRMESLNNSDMEDVFEVIVDCIDSVYDSDQVYQAKEQSKQELMDFLNNLTSDQFAEVQKFFETMPKLTEKVSYNCPVCGKEHNKVLEGLSSFF